MPKERPILMSTENVKAILEGRKTQTRRILKPQPPEKASVWLIENGNTGEKHFEVRRCNPWHTIVCPYGQVGDRLWVRETWCAGCANESERCACYKVLDDGRLPKFFPSCKESIVKPSIFMPRWASRITLELTEIRVERLQEITEEDAIAEGITTSDRTGRYLPGNCDYARWAYWELWDSVNPKYPWESNPWVWVLTFKVI